MQIGLEIHVELNTRTKLFCPCPRNVDEPNTAACPICLGHPGTRPRTNKQAIQHALKTATALNADINDELIFARKSYFYPDMPKNYQITQYDQPLARNGELHVNDTTIPLTRLHVEEDPAALDYPRKINNSEYVRIDYNRAGTPLVEIVTEPAITTPEQARNVIDQLTTLLAYLNVYNPQTCTVRTDANISLANTARVEVKNITGAKAVAQALRYEQTRQTNRKQRGLDIQRETRSWNGTTTTATRTKEHEHDYGYVLEPDIPKRTITNDWLNTIQSNMPTLPRERKQHYINDGIPEDDAHVLAHDTTLANHYETLRDINPRLVATWLRREYLRVLNYHDLQPGQANITTQQLRELFTLINDDEINEKTGQDIMEQLAETNIYPREYVEENQLGQVKEDNTLQTICNDVINDNPNAVQDYHDGEDQALNYLVGQVMQATNGRAEPERTKTILHDLLTS